MRIGLLISGTLLLLPSAAIAADKELVFDLKVILATPLNPRTLKSSEKDGVVTEEVMFHAEKDGDKSVDIFALFSYPKGAKKLPAFVWNQGGLHRATPYWTEFGAKRGYAVLCIDFPLPGYRSTGGYPITAGLELGADPRQAPIYHGAVALLKAVSYLESRPEVDRERIGMAGSSWGGFFTTLLVGLDGRLKAGSCLYGCGGLDLGNVWWDGNGRGADRDPAFRRRWRTTLDPAGRLANVKTPLAWFSGTNDSFYWMPALMQSYEAAAGPKHLSLLPNWNHALTPALDEQLFAWLDVYLKGAPAFLQLTPAEVVKQDGRLLARWNISGTRVAASAELILSPGEAGNWSGRYWQTVKAEIKDRTCTAELPAVALPYYVSGAVVDRDGFRYSTPLLAVDPAALGVKTPGRVPAYDGCAEWGGFEEAQVTFLRLHGLPIPPLSPDAREGKQAAVCKAGKTALPPLLCTAGVPHRFTCYLKASQPVEVTVQLGGSADGKPIDERKQFSIGTEWTEVTMDFTPPRALALRLQTTITLPAGASGIVDAVQFRPVKAEGR